MYYTYSSVSVTLLSSALHFQPVQCCNYGTNGQNRQGYDCVQIPGAVKTTGIATPSRICGRNVGLGTDDTSVAAMAMKTVCCEKWRGGGRKFEIVVASEHG